MDFKDDKALVAQVKEFLDFQLDRYHRPDFIDDDPISIPHLFSKKQDIEIAGFFAAILAWGQRKTILKNCRFLLSCMDNAPYDFVQNFETADWQPLQKFVHRTYNATDLFYTLRFLQHHYREHRSLETAFSQFSTLESTGIKDLLTGFHHYFFHLADAPQRTRKHIASPEKHSACKRLNMYLRWMVRPDKEGIDFGLWTKINPSCLICPLDVHSGRVARKLGLLLRPQNDWKAAVALTENLKLMRPEDPVLYDFALFGLGVEGF